MGERQGSALHPLKDPLKRVLENPLNFKKYSIVCVYSQFDGELPLSPWVPAHWVVWGDALSLAFPCGATRKRVRGTIRRMVDEENI